MTAREAWVEDPRSAQIANDLNTARADVCVHGKDPCYLRCGVRRGIAPHWTVITKIDRLSWRVRALGY